MQNGYEGGVYYGLNPKPKEVNKNPQLNIGYNKEKGTVDYYKIIERVKEFKEYKIKINTILKKIDIILNKYINIKNMNIKNMDSINPNDINILKICEQKLAIFIFDGNKKKNISFLPNNKRKELIKKFYLLNKILNINSKNNK